MTTVKFYIYTDDYSSYEAMTESIIERFKIEYPEAQSETDHDEDEEILSISITVDTDDIEDIDTFTCEEICHEHEVYCEIKSDNSEETKNFYFDEEDVWSYR